MPLRVAFDLDGVLADMDGELARQAGLLFGDAAARGSMGGSTAEAPAAAAPETSDQPQSEDANPEVVEHDPSRLPLTNRQEHRLWRHVTSIEDFWESLKEIEPGTITRLSKLAAERGWEVIFLTKRPATAGSTAQRQSQRWLAANGFELPSVFVVQGSRGRIAASLGLDFVVDDRPENCLDVVVDSRARAILVWRERQESLPAAAKRLGIGVVKSVDECLSILVQLDAPPSQRTNVIDRVMRLLGLKEPA